MKDTKQLYHGYRFHPTIISHAVWLYHRFCLSFRDVEDVSGGFSIVPIPPAVLLYSSGILGLIAMAKRRKAA